MELILMRFKFDLDVPMRTPKFERVVEQMKKNAAQPIGAGADGWNRLRDNGLDHNAFVRTTLLDTVQNAHQGIERVDRFEFNIQGATRVKLRNFKQIVRFSSKQLAMRKDAFKHFLLARTDVADLIAEHELDI